MENEAFRASLTRIPEYSGRRGRPRKNAEKARFRVRAGPPRGKLQTFISLERRSASATPFCTRSFRAGRHTKEKKAQAQRTAESSLWEGGAPPTFGCAPPAPPGAGPPPHPSSKPPPTKQNKGRRAARRRLNVNKILLANAHDFYIL